MSYISPKKWVTSCLLAAGWIPRAWAQNVAISSTAAWSSQIVAFWGAVGIGVRSSSGLQSSNGITSVAASMAAFWRALAAWSALGHGEWYLMSPGYNGGNTRLDIVLVCWSNPDQLWQACLKVAMLAEVVGRQRWLVLVVSRQLRPQQAAAAAGAYWTHSPRHPNFSLARFADPIGGIYSPFPDEDNLQEIIQRYYVSAAQGHNDTTMVNAVAKLLCEEALQDMRPTRGATYNEAPAEVQEATTMGRHITYFQHEGVTTPYVSIEKLVGNFAASRQGVVRSAAILYCVVHTIVCVAVGLMGAASGRGLAVWLFTPRMVMSKLGAEAIAGDDTLLSLLGFHNVTYQYTSEAGNAISLPADAFLPCRTRSRPILLALFLNVVELVLICSGWLYGSLKVEKFAPRGVVGHGMLWLATLVATGLSLRTLYSVYQRVSARLIGIFDEPHYVRLVVAKDCRIKFPAPTSNFLGFASDILSKTEDDTTSMTAGLSLMRHPTFCLELCQHAASHCLNYSYQGDTLACEGNKKITTAGEYPWVQLCLCVCLTFSCSVFGAVYAYVDIMPRWSKLTAEALLATSAIWFTTLARTSKLEHSRSTEICHMVATMVASAVWYVGVKDVG
eukprot:c17532_g1_i1 orf=60-1907(-)